MALKGALFVSTQWEAEITRDLVVCRRARSRGHFAVSRFRAGELVTEITEETFQCYNHGHLMRLATGVCMKITMANIS